MSRACWRDIRFSVFNSLAQKTSLIGIPPLDAPHIAVFIRVNAKAALKMDFDQETDTMYSRIMDYDQRILQNWGLWKYKDAPHYEQ